MDPENTLEKYHEEKDLQALREHRDVILALKDLLQKPEGLTLFKYLFKTLDVLELPERGMEGNELHDRLGFLRAGNSIYKLMCEASPEITASILSKLERQRYDELYEQHSLK